MPIKKVGVELEGGWESPPKGIILTHDVSVMQPKGFMAGRNHWGEAVSEPLERKDVASWIEKFYPTHIPETINVGATNERSCGLHVHISFDELWEYRALVQKRYHEWLLSHFKEWGERMLSSNHIFWHRWNGGNRFCTRDFAPHIQMKWKEKGHNRLDRRTQLNYTWGYLGTVEFRMLPMFPDARLRDGDERVTGKDVETAINSVEFFLSATEKWLREVEKKERERQAIHHSLLFATEREGPLMVTEDITPKKRG